MNHQDYLEYEGTRLVSYALQTFCRPSSGSLTGDMERALLADGRELSGDEREKILALSFEYMLFRLYVASSMIRGWKGCMGCQQHILTGLADTLASLPEALKLLAMEREISGSYLVLGRHAKEMDRPHVDTMLAAYEAIDRSARDMGGASPLDFSIDASIAHMAQEIGVTLSPSLAAYLAEETRAFMASLSARLARMTPEKLHHWAHRKTVLHADASPFTREVYDRLYPAFTVLASMAAGFLYMFA